MHRFVLRNYLHERVVHLGIYNRSQYPDQGGGTGFHVIAPSGKVFIMTNRHVCDMTTTGKLWAVVEGVTSDHEVDVVYVSDHSDLCLVAPIDGIRGLEIGEPLEQGQEIYYLGHPRSQQDTFVSGEAVGYHLTSVGMGVIGQSVREDMCKRKDMYVLEETELQVFLNQLSSVIQTPEQSNLVDLVHSDKKVKVCYERDMALVTTMMIYAGASGSPMVDSFGKVIGVVYAAPPSGGWGYGVTLPDIKEILTGR
jgi:hypothetical protein